MLAITGKDSYAMTREEAEKYIGALTDEEVLSLYALLEDLEQKRLLEQIHQELIGTTE